MTTLTLDQAIATRPDASVWVSASAGTGKTHVLTARVIRLLVTGVRPEKILCLTFTKAAAAEMKNRIFAELGQWTILGDEDLSAKIYSRTGEEADPEMLARARSLFATVLDVPGGLKIQTIHSFCQSILGRFPIEAGLNPNPDVMDDRTAAELLKASRDEVLIEARERSDDKFLRAMAHIATRISEKDLDSLIGALSRERGHLGALLKNAGGLDLLTNKVFDALGINRETDDDALCQQIVCAPDMDRDGMQLLATALLQGSKTEKEKGAVIAALLAETGDRTVHAQNFSQVFLTAVGDPRKSVANKPTLEKYPELDAIIDAERDRQLDINDTLRKRRAAENTNAVLMLADAVIARYARKKSGRGKVDYDDLIYRTDQLLATANIAPWILYKLDGGVDHILVDEAQDTNPEQWRLVESLSAEFFAGLSAREDKRSVFAVGDSKQSIYGFQRADPEAFKDARDRISERAENAELPFHSVGLHQSFRSTAAVLDVVDAVFHKDHAGAGMTPDEEDIAHETNRIGDAGLVELWPPEDAELEAARADWDIPTDQRPNTSGEGRLAQRIAAHIKTMLDKQDLLESQNRAVRPGDIMILVRRRGTFADHMIRALKSLNIPVAGADRMMLNEQLAVMDLMALAEFAILPDDDLNLATLLKTPLIGLDDDDLIALAPNRGNKSLWQYLKERASENKHWGDAVALLSRVMATADYTTPFVFFSGVLNQEGRQKILVRLGHEANDPIDEFLAQCLQFEMDHAPSLQNFLHWLRSGETEIKRDMEQGQNLVRIMTVHGAKGLQAPIIYLPDTCQVPRHGETFLSLGSDESALHDIPLLLWTGGSENEAGELKTAREAAKAKQDAEQKRLLYVAMTRAEDRLYIGGWETKNTRPAQCWYNMIAKGFESLPAEENGAILRYSCPQTREVDRKDTPISAPTSAVDFPDWATNPAPQELKTTQPLRPSMIEDITHTRSPLGEGGTKDRSRWHRGRVIHKLLEVLPSTAPDQRRERALKIAAQSPWDLTTAEAEEIWAKLELVLTHPDLQPLFSDKARAEVALGGKVGDDIISAQVDRLYVDDENVLVVDFKSNRPPPSDVDSIPTAYLNQMAAYKVLLAEIYPGHAITSALLWTEEARLMEIPEQMLMPYMEKLRPKAQ